MLGGPPLFSDPPLYPTRPHPRPAGGVQSPTISLAHPKLIGWPTLPPTHRGSTDPYHVPGPSGTDRQAVCFLFSRPSFAFHRRDGRPLSPHSTDAPFRRRVAPALAPGGSRNGTPAAIKFNLTNVILLDSFYTVLFEI